MTGAWEPLEVEPQYPQHLKIINKGGGTWAQTHTAGNGANTGSPTELLVQGVGLEGSQILSSPNQQSLHTNQDI